jgi:uncharacterized protein (TIRG00374 family)
MLRLLKIFVSAGLIAVLVWSVEWREIYSHASEFDLVLALLAVLILIMQYPLSAWKWQQSLALHGVNYPLGYLLRVLCIAFYFNNFLPTAIGGDTYRAYRTFKNADRPAYSISAIIVERALGLLVLVFFGYLSAVVLVVTGTLHYEKALLAVTGVGAICLLLLLLLWRAGYLIKIATRLGKIAKLEPLTESFRVMRANRQHAWGVIILSLLFQATAIGAITILFSALALPAKFFESGFTAAAAGVAGIIPLSINGIGIVEGSFAIAATLVNLPYAQAVIVALFLRIFGLASSIVFGILYIFERSADGAASKGKSE